MFSPQDYFYMNQALRQAQSARFLSDPNPRVGCVLVQDQEIIGAGFTQAVGSHHAEVMAIHHAQARGKNTLGATAYVTLEPCSHFGKTPPCADALVAAGIKKVFVGAVDPNPLVRGKGILRLENQGLKVVSGLLDTQSIALNFGFFKRMQTGLPWVRLKVAMSIDGYTALPNGKSQWITSVPSRRDGHRWRAQASVVLTGIGTILEDDPQLNVRDIDTPRQPLKAIIDAKLDTPPSAKIVQTGQVIIFCASHDNEKMSRLFAVNPHIKIIPLPNSAGKVDLAAAFKYLGDQYHANEVHVEAGFKLNGSLLREGCVDELLIYQAPILLGGGLGMANIPPLDSLLDLKAWNPIDIKHILQDTRLRLLRRE